MNRPTRDKYIEKSTNSCDVFGYCDELDKYADELEKKLEQSYDMNGMTRLYKVTLDMLEKRIKVLEKALELIINKYAEHHYLCTDIEECDYSFCVEGYPKCDSIHRNNDNSECKFFYKRRLIEQAEKEIYK